VVHDKLQGFRWGTLMKIPVSFYQFFFKLRLKRVRETLLQGFAKQEKGSNEIPQPQDSVRGIEGTGM
jgi:hypothetical protein